MMGTSPLWRGGALALLLAPTVFAAACGGEGSGSADGKVELRFAWWGSNTRHELTNQVIERFEQQNPNIEIVGEYTGWDGYWDKLATTVAGQNTPDIIQMDWLYLREYADRGVLADLSGSVDTTNIDRNLLGTGEVEGELAGVPAAVNAFSVVADPRVFDRAGVDMPDDETWSWSDYADIATRISENTPDDVYGTEQYGSNEPSLQILARQRGEALFSENGVGFSEQTAIDWWRRELGMQESGAAPPASVTAELASLGVDQSLVANQKAAMAMWWSNQLTALVEASGNDNLELLRMPGETTNQQPGMYLKPSMFFSISARTEHPDEAAKFVNFMLNAPEAVRILGSERGLPVNTELRERIKGQLSATDVKVAEFIDEISGDLGPPPVAPPKGAGEFNTITQRMNEEVLFQRTDPSSAAKRFIREGNSAIGE